ncbi:DUF6111 family protein [Tepidamorphus sp. 3E244]|uniref:DUF6111 family protein n=1 Tax=Tepidamorphus sp. 3E244 TaxID=3385498 RepID=UPI0038FC56AD
MIRIIAIQLLFFLMPFALYGFYLYFNNRSVDKSENWRPQLYTLIASGMVITIAAFVLMAAFTGAPPDGVYVPPRVEDGVVIPGEVK